jgi:hypothetical protein
MRAKITVLILVLWTMAASAQFAGSSRERLILGGNVGSFRISYDGFKELYGGRSGLTLGALAIVKIATPYHAMVKYRQFEKDSDVLRAGVMQQQLWEEKWYNIGMRYLAYGDRKLTSYFGFGFAIFRIKETGPASVFGREPGKRDASGFFLDGGLEYRFIKLASLYFELEVTSAGIEGKSGFEGASVGGFLIGTGINLFVL